jgi:predicted Fe-S protein YdhL (DUF1289 family)
MEQLEIFPITSPCIGVCEINQKGFCKGCFRNREERFNWLNMKPSMQREVINLCIGRKRRMFLSIGRMDKDVFFDRVQKSLDGTELALDFNTKNEIEEHLFTDTGNPELSEKTIKILFYFLNMFFFPFLVSCIATIYMEKTNVVREIFKQKTSSREVAIEVRRNVFDIAGDNIRVVTSHNLNLRDGPSIKSDEIGILSIGDVVEVIDSNRSWLYIRAIVDSEVRTGWIFRRYTKKIQVTPRVEGRRSE